MKTLLRYLGLVGGLALVGIGALTLLSAPSAALTTCHDLLADSDLARVNEFTAALAALGCWLLIGWALVAASVTAVVTVGGSVGRLADLATQWLSPRLVRQALATILGVTLVTGLVAAGPAQAHATGQPTPPPAYSLNADWPITGETPAALPPPPNQAGSSGQAADSSHQPTPRNGEAGYEQAPGPRINADSKLDGVTVATGDSLWSIAKRTLGPQATDAQIAAEWPRWWQANRALIGDDPNLIVAGQELIAPDQPNKAE